MEGACTSCGRPLPADARFCPSCAAPVTSAPTDEERKIVTVLFADVTGSTALGEQLDPERLRAVMRAYFAAASSAIQAWGGTVEKFIGDAVMAVFGVPVIREDDAERALRAGLELGRRLTVLNAELQERHGLSLAVRIGINTGEVVAPRRTGSGDELVTGDPVNVASRLEQAAEPGTILVGERTYLATRDAFEFAEPMMLQLKGKREAIAARRPLRARPESARGIPGLRAGMVGRDRELGLIVGSLDTSIDTGRPQLVLVYGPAGIGKSRLAHEAIRVIGERDPRVRVLRGRCLAAGPGVAFWPLAEILRATCAISLDEPAESAQDKLRSRLAEILAPLGLSDAEARDTIAALATTAGVTMPEDALAGLEPQVVADRLARAWPRFASALALERPTVVVIEDLHWASGELLAMLERVLGRTTGPVLLLATARPEFAQSHAGFAAGREDVTSLTLRPLNERETSTLMDELLSLADLPAEVRARIGERAEGNPFYLEEILRRLIDEGALVRDGERWRTTAHIGSTPLPDTVHALLAARIDALPSEEKRVLQEAAVVGRTFWEEPVHRALGDGEVGHALLALEARGLVAARTTSTIAGQVEYHFKHALIRDVAYAGLPRSRQARSNAAVAAWIEATAPDRRTEFLELLAHFYQAALAQEDADLAWADDPSGHGEVRRRAFRALTEAGEAARHRYALDLALERHAMALSVAADDAERSIALEAMGDDEEAAFHGDEAWETYRRVADLARDQGDRDRLARVALKGARVAAKIGTFRTRPDGEAVEQLLNEGLEAVRDDATRARLLVEKGAHVPAMREVLEGTDPLPLEERFDAVREALRLAEKLGDPDLQLAAEGGLGSLHWSAHDFDAAVASSRRQLALAEHVTSASHKALVLYEASHTIRDTSGDYAEGRELARRSYRIAKGLSNHELMHATAQWMIASYWLGLWDEIEPVLEEHLTAFETERDRTCSSVRSGPAIAALLRAERGDRKGAEHLLRMIGDRAFGFDSPAAIAALALVALGDHEGALERAWRLTSGHGGVLYGYRTLALVEALAASGDWDRLAEAIATARMRAPEMRVLAPAADRAEARLLAARGATDEARELLQRALGEFDGLGLPFEAARTRELLAGVTDGEERAEARRSALDTYRDLGAEPSIARLTGTLGSGP
jgi:class 3 adenylate cyclase/tetratricopeptide (TPR) repeat protein